MITALGAAGRERLDGEDVHVPYGDGRQSDSGIERGPQQRGPSAQNKRKGAWRRT